MYNNIIKNNVNAKEELVILACKDTYNTCAFTGNLRQTSEARLMRYLKPPAPHEVLHQEILECKMPQSYKISIAT